MDSGFSIIETCSEQDFLRYSGGKAAAAPNLTIRQLKEPIVPAAQNLKDDARYGCVVAVVAAAILSRARCRTVFLYLDAAATLDRYRDQLGADQSSLVSVSLVVVNHAEHHNRRSTTRSALCW